MIVILLLTLSILTQPLNGVFNLKFFSANQLFETQDPDVAKSFKDIVEQHGYLYEEHRITTNDGYILKLF